MKGYKHAETVNEDRFSCEGDVFADSGRCQKKVSFVGVYDGHGGTGCSEYVAEGLLQHFRLSKAWDRLEGIYPDKELLEGVLIEALLEAVSATESLFSAYAGRVADDSGSCVLAAAFCEGAAVVCNLGDSRAMYQAFGDPASLVLTEPHDCHNPKEVQRVAQVGGHFVQNRLFGVLEPTRALGNEDFRKYAPGVLLSTPETYVIRMKPNGGSCPTPSFLLLASDGLWDSLDTHTIKQVVKAGLKRQHRQLSTVNIAECLVKEAVQKGSNDDCTAVLVLFK